MKNPAVSYVMSGAKIKEEQYEKFVVGPASPPWVSPGIVGGTFLLIAVVLLLAGGAGTFPGFFVAIIGITLIASITIASQATFDFAGRKLIFTSDYLIRSPRHVKLEVPFSQIGELSLRPSRSGKPRFLDVKAMDGTLIALEFGVRRQEAEKILLKFNSLAGAEPTEDSRSAEMIIKANNAQTREQMERGLQSWMTMQIFLGILQMVAAKGFSPWGALLILVGLASAYFKEAGMYPVFAVTMAWAGISNLLSSTSISWKAFAFIQFLFTISIFRLFLRYRKLEQAEKEEAGSQAKPGRAERAFPWLSAILGLAAIVGYAAFWIVSFANAAFHFYAKDDLIWNIVNLLADASIYSALLGLATGLAGWLSGFSQKWASILGTIASAIILVAHLILVIVLNLT